MQGTWIEKARKAVTIKFESGQTKVVKQPRIIQEVVTYAGKGVSKGPREKDGLGPSWKELYVGQRVTLSHDAIRRRALYKIRDQAGVSALLERGDTVYKAAIMCTGVIVNAIEDNQLQTDVTYAPVCFMFQLSWACWHASKQLLLHTLSRRHSTLLVHFPSLLLPRAQGKKITNYVCYPGGASWVRWDTTKVRFPLPLQQGKGSGK